MLIAAIVIAAILGFTLLLSFVVYYVVFYNRNNVDNTYHILTGGGYDVFRDQVLAMIDEAVKIPYESVEIKGYDGTRLCGRFYLKDENAPVHIEVHGYRGNAIRDFCGGMLLALRRNENVLLVDQRSHGKSAGHTISFGIKERRDVLSWVDYACRRFGEEKPLYIHGISMGAATVLMASDMDLPKNVLGIVADCPYAEPFAIIKKVAKEIVPFAPLLYPFIVIGAALYGRFNLLETSALAAVKKTKLPILLIHGTADRFVPVEMSRALKAANPAITYVEVEGAPHGFSYLKDFPKYDAAYDAFMAQTRRKSDDAARETSFPAG